MRRTLLSLSLLFFAVLPLAQRAATTPATSQDAQDDKRRGLIAAYVSKGHGVEVVARTPNFALDAGESLHEQLEAEFAARWRGYVRIEEAGLYRFFAKGAKVLLGGKDALSGSRRLSAGDHILEVVYERKPGPARLQLRWSSEHFAEGPMPSSVFFHDPKVAAGRAALQEQAAIEVGRRLFEDLACASCHEAGSWGTTRRAPVDLSTVGSRVRQVWLREWLTDPHAWRGSNVMPSLLGDAQERAHVAEFLSQLRSPESKRSAIAPAAPARIAAGRQLFETTGCNKCHGSKSQSLDRVGDKFAHPEALARYLLDPLHVDPSGRMPRFFDPNTQGHEARLVAEYLYHKKRRSPQEPAGTPPPRSAGDAQLGRQLFAQRGCVACHQIRDGDEQLVNKLSAPAFAQAKPLRLLQHWALDGKLSNQVAKGEGRAVGTLSFAAPAPALGRGQSLYLDGKSHVVLPHVERPHEMSISAWVKLDGKGGAVLAWGKTARDGRDGTREFLVGERRNTMTYGEFESGRGWKHVTRRSKHSLRDNKWHHVAVVRRGSVAQCYLDGEPLASPGSVQRTAPGHSDALALGALLRGQRVAKRFKGWIDDVTLWANALSVERIRSLAQGADPQSIARGPRVRVGDWSSKRGCLADTAKAPAARYELTAAQRASLRAFLESMRRRPPKSVAPIRELRRRVQQLNCTACHELDEINRDDEAPYVDGEPVERPPPLTWAGQKLTTQRLRRVLLENERLWPWMKLRMPDFGAAVADLPELFAAHGGVPGEDPSSSPSLALGREGIKLIGAARGQASCLVCHNYRGINRRFASAVPAPDLAAGKGSLRWDWFRQWMASPSWMKPGTSMPMYWGSLTSPERHANIERIWAALVHQDKLALPPGLIQKQTDGERIVVGDEAVVFRAATVVPGFGQVDRAINVGLPGGVHYCFDATTCRLVYVWKGGFIDAGPAWNGRGGKPVTAKGTSLWTAGPEFVLRVAGRGARATGDSRGRVRFRGYRLEKGRPVFAFDLDGLRVEQRVVLDVKTVTLVFDAEKALEYVGSRATEVEGKSAGSSTRRTRVVLDMAKGAK